MRTNVPLQRYLLAHLSLLGLLAGCTVDSEGDCDTGAIRTQPCGENGEGTATYICSEKERWAPGECILPPDCIGEACTPSVIPCTEGDQRVQACADNAGIQQYQCHAGAWEENGECVIACTDDETQTIPCGLNGKSLQTLRCTDGMWNAQNACVDIDECRNNDRTTRACTRGDVATMDGLCIDGQWQWDPCQAISFDGSTQDLTTFTGTTFCAVRHSGRIACWGDNSQGQLGQSHTQPVKQAVHVVNIANATHVAVGARHACALLDDQSVHCWGNNSVGQLGDGTTTNRSTPRAIDGLAAIAIAAGDDHTCAIDPEYNVLCWGSNANGQLGDGTTTNRNLPTMVVDIIDIHHIRAGAGVTCAQTDGLSNYCWGNTDDFPLGISNPSPTTRPTETTISVGIDTWTFGYGKVCAINNNLPYCWGKNDGLRLGISSVDTLAPTSAVAGLDKIAHLTAGVSGGCAVSLETKKTYCWGVNGFGERGNGTTNAATAPDASAVKDLGPVITVESGSSALASTSCVIDWEGRIACWGSNAGNALGGDYADSQRSFPSIVSLPVQD